MTCIGVFGLYVTPEKVGDAEITLGGVDESHIHGLSSPSLWWSYSYSARPIGEIQTASLPSDNDDTWLLSSSAIYINGKTTSLLSQKREIIFDSGTSNAYFDPSIAEVRLPLSPRSHRSLTHRRTGDLFIHLPENHSLLAGVDGVRDSVRDPMLRTHRARLRADADVHEHGGHAVQPDGAEQRTERGPVPWADGDVPDVHQCYRRVEPRRREPAQALLHHLQRGEPDNRVRGQWCVRVGDVGWGVRLTAL